MPIAECLQWPAVVVESQDLMRVAIGYQDGSIRRQIDVVRLRKLALAPRAFKPATLIEYQDRPVGAALGDMHPAPSIDHQVGDESEAFASRQTRPAAVNGIPTVAKQDNVALVRHGHQVRSGVPALAGTSAAAATIELAVLPIGMATATVAQQRDMAGMRFLWLRMHGKIAR